MEISLSPISPATFPFVLFKSSNEKSLIPVKSKLDLKEVDKKIEEILKE